MTRRAGAAAVSIVVAVALGWLWDREARGPGATAGTPERSATAEIGRGGPIAFAPEACVSYEPTRRANGRTVFLDPGHGGLDAGAVSAVTGAPVSEKRVTLALARRALVLLRRKGYRVVLSRNTDSTVARTRRADVDGRFLTPEAIRRDVAARNLCANAGKADVLVGLHLNSFDDPSVGGVETVYNPKRRFSARSARLAAALQSAVSDSIVGAGLPTQDRGVRTDAGAGGEALTPEAAAYGQLLQLGPAAAPWFRFPSTMPGAIVEALFLTRPEEAGFALSARGRQAIAAGLVDGLTAYFAPAGEPVR